MKKPVEAAAIALRDEIAKPDKSLSLYDLVDALNAIDDMLDENGGDLTEDIVAALEAVGGESAFPDKIERICQLRRNVLATADMLQSEVERLQKRAEMFRRKGESLRHYMHDAFVRRGEAKIKTGRFTIWRQNNPLSVKWTRDVEELPVEYRRVKVEPDIATAKADHEAGRQLPDGFVVTQGEHLRIL